MEDYIPLLIIVGSLAILSWILWRRSRKARTSPEAQRQSLPEIVTPTVATELDAGAEMQSSLENWRTTAAIDVGSLTAVQPSLESIALTKYIKAHYKKIYNAKRRGRGLWWKKGLGLDICETDILTERLTVKEKFAVVFLLNSVFHAGDLSLAVRRRAEKKKTFVQRTIIVYHFDEVRLRAVGDEEESHRGTYEVSYGIWSTHVPKSLVRRDRLERPNKPSANAVLRAFHAKEK